MATGRRIIHERHRDFSRKDRPMQRWVFLSALLLTAALAATWTNAGEKASSKDNTPPPGFTALFNGKDLTGWQGLLMAPDPEDKKGKKPRNIPAWLVKLPA